MIKIYRNIHNIILCIFIIGIINIFNIVKYGITFNIPTINFDSQIKQTTQEVTYSLILNHNHKGYPLPIKNFNQGIIENIININEKNIKLILIISISILIIFNILPENKYDKLKFNIRKKSIEYELLIGLGLIGIIIMLISNDLFLIYLGLELYSFTIYILILIKETINTRRISIVYLIISSISSGFLLISFFLLYKYTGSFNIFWIKNILNITYFINSKTSGISNNEQYIFFILFFSLLFKLGTIPFSYWIIRVYGNLEKFILFYQLIIPKLVFIYLLIKFLNFLSSSSLSTFVYIFFFISILSLLFSSIGGLFQFQFNSLLSYSSILNISFLLLSLSLILSSLSSPISDNSFLSTLSEGTLDIISNPSLWVIFQFFFVYIINLISLFSFFSIYSRSSNIFKFSNFFPLSKGTPNHDLEAKVPVVGIISLFISILSFIGFPPFAGFYAKFVLFFTLFSSTIINGTYFNISTIALFIFILSTIISSFFYFKFLYSSSINYFLEQPRSLRRGEINPKESVFSSSNLGFIQIRSRVKAGGILLSFSSLFLIFYPFYFSFFFPFFFF